MVGGCTSDGSRARRPQTNYGTRIDCYAWADGVWTTFCQATEDWGSPPTNNCYGNFNGTSSATAIIAGAALCVQGVVKARGGLLTPGQMRALLSDPLTGTKSANPATDGIGVMPDLGQVIAQAALVPDVYVRDSIADDGTVPPTTVGDSPDIIVSGAHIADADAQAMWGEGSGFENRDDFGAGVAAGHDAWVYVRLKNRSSTNVAAQARAQVFWAAPPATLLTPDKWNLIGTTAPIDVPAGDTLSVAGGLLWPAADRPAGAEHCWLGAVAGSLLDPAPLLPPPNDFDAFIAFLRFSNNVAWRNISVVQLPSSPFARQAETTPFEFTGAQEMDLNFDFEILQRLPAGTRAYLRVAPTFAGLCQHGTLEARPDKQERRTVLTLPALRRLAVRSVAMPAGRRFPADLLLEVGAGVQLNGHSVTIRQLYQGVELGRLTWRFVDRPVATTRPA
jgi:hypothetical protein